MAAHQQHVPLLEHAVGALYNLLHGGAISVADIPRDGILAAVISALRAHPACAELHDCGRRLLRKLPPAQVIAAGAPRAWLGGGAGAPAANASHSSGSATNGASRAPMKPCGVTLAGGGAQLPIGAATERVIY